jgi:hypothetical protein
MGPPCTFFPLLHEFVCADEVGDRIRVSLPKAIFHCSQLLFQLLFNVLALLDRQQRSKLGASSTQQVT